MRRGLLIAVAAAGCAGKPVRHEIDRKKLEEVKARAVAFLDLLAPKMDPARLRGEHGMKGKKHFVEYLLAYSILHASTPPGEEKARLRMRLAEAARPASDPAYHDLSALPTAEFDQDVAAYLDACRILESAGMDTKVYRAEIHKILHRIIRLEHLDRGGITSNLAISYGLRALGFSGGYSAREVYERPGCIVRSHPELGARDRKRIYDLTHEIFYLTEFGARPLAPADAGYAKTVVPRLITECIEREDPDLVAELLLCLKFLGHRDVMQFGEAIDYLLSRQNDDGSWGNYDEERKYAEKHRPNYLVDVGHYLHTVTAVLWALLAP